jgi:ATP-binding cassette subfamily B protein
LFSDTVAANISFGCPHAVSQDAIEEAARQAVVLDNILGFPDGFRTEVGERGITLSGGQKQRISIARALVRNPDVLVFDDCLSAVDTWTEARILSNLQDLMKGKTTIVISHRVQSVQACDRIIVLEEGCMVEEGDHHSLIGKAGVYAQLVESQSLESNSSDSEIGNR